MNLFHQKNLKPILKTIFLQKYGIKDLRDLVLIIRKKMVGLFIYLVGIQPSQYGGQCCVNLGVYIKNIPFWDSINSVDIKKIKYYYCEFQQRLHPEGKNNDYWWKYKSNSKGNIRIASDMYQAFEEHGLGFFMKFIEYPNPFLGIKIDDIINKRYTKNGLWFTTDFRLAVLLAYINYDIKRFSEAKAFAEWAQSQIKGHIGASWRKPLKDIIKEIDKKL